MWYEPIVGAILFGIITIIVGYVSGYIIKKFDNSKVPEECAEWNKNHIMKKSLFITGALTWLLSFGYTKYSQKLV